MACSRPSGVRHRRHPVAALVGDFQVIVEPVQQHSDHRTDHFEVTEFLSGDVHEEVVHLGILLPEHEGLGEVLQCSGELAVGATELLQHERGEARIGLGDSDLELKTLVMHEHCASWAAEKKMAQGEPELAFEPGAVVRSSGESDTASMACASRGERTRGCAD